MISGRSPINDKFTKDLRRTHSSHQRFSEQKKATETHDLQTLVRLLADETFRTSGYFCFSFASMHRVAWGTARRRSLLIS